MDSIKLSSKGQVIIPKHIRSAYHWEPGQEFILIDSGDGILLTPKAPFSEQHSAKWLVVFIMQDQPKRLTEWIAL